jgi:hypothetical protein
VAPMAVATTARAAAPIIFVLSLMIVKFHLRSGDRR